MSNKILGLYFLFFFLLVPSVCISFEDNKVSGMEETKKAVFAQSREVVEDLLMFWEEKDLFVQTATRNEKPISQVAENMTVITAKGDAMPDGGKLYIKKDAFLLSDKQSSGPLQLQPGRYVRVCVTDTGIGIEPEIRDRIFEPGG